MATHNGERFVREQIDSVLAQEDGNWHLTVSDDGSADGTREILAGYAREYPEKVTFRDSGKKYGNARDHFFDLIRTCGAEWMLLCDQDDTWMPGKVKAFAAAAADAESRYGRETPVLVFSDQVPTDEALHPLADSLMRYQKQYTGDFDFRRILMQNVVTGGAAGFNRALARTALECADTSRVIMHDWWLAAAAARFGQVIYLPETTGTYRQHGGNDTGAKDFGSAAYNREQLGKLAEVRESVRKKKEQARVFTDTYRKRLTEEDLRFLEGFAKQRSGIGFYLRYGKLIYRPERKIGMALLG